MLRRLISEDRLDRGLWQSAGEGGKILMCCGGGCFFFWCWVTSMLFASMLNFDQVLTKESSRVLEVPCRENVQVSTEGLHHISGCPFKQEHFNGSFHLKVGDFYVGKFKGCGAALEKMYKGQVAQGGLVSFLGNTSGGILKPWVVNRARVCNFAEGAVAAPIMIQQVKQAQVTGTFIGVLFCFTLLYWASSCLFFAERNLDYGDAWCRNVAIAFLALVMSCIGGTLTFIYGDAGLWIGAFIFTLVIFIGFDKRCYDCIQKRRSQDPEEDEEQPLLANSNDQAPAYDNAHRPFAAPPVETPQPVAAPPVETPQPGARLERLEESDDDDDGRARSGGQSLAMAIGIGIAAGLLGGIVISLGLVLLTSRQPDPARLAMAFNLF